MKTLKKVSLLLCAVLAISMFAGCGAKFDASAYVKAVLDNSYKNDSSGYVSQKIATAEEAKKVYDQGIDTEMNALVSSAGFSISDDTKAKFRTTFEKLFAAADYTVKEAEKQDDGSYKVTIEYKQLKVFENALKTFLEKAGEVDQTSYTDQQALYDDLTMMLADCIDAEVAAAQYGDVETMTVTVKLANKAYTVDQNDLLKLEQSLFDIAAASM